MTSKKKQLSSIAGAAMLIALLGAVLLNGSAASGEESLAARETASLMEHFSVLQKTAPEQTTALSPEASQMLASMNGGNGEVDATGTTTTSNSNQAVISLSEGTVCAFEESGGNGGGACGSPEEAIDGKLVSIGFCKPGVPDGSVLVFGVVPDAVNQVTIKGTDQSPNQIAQVVGNVYEANVPEVDATITASGENGDPIEVHLPIGQLAKANGTCA
jgi:hypothetical protein